MKRVSKYSMVSRSTVACTVLVGAVLSGCSDGNSDSGGGAGAPGAGADGVGLAGSSAIDGKDGVDGEDGINGKDGADGKDGTNGKDGTDGKDGAKGKDGDDAPISGPAALFVSTPRSLTSATSATFAFGCSAGTCSYQCSLDHAAYAACKSPVTVSDLSRGDHEFSVKAKLAGQDPGPVSTYEWRVRQPNILYIMADDLGYSDVHALGGEIDTPNLDELISNGRILTNHHAGTVSAITRSMLISGTDHHLVGEGTMGAPNDERKGLPGYEGFLNDRSLSLAELLKDAGYHTYIAGKWHIGSGIVGSVTATSGKTPDQWGFERSYTLLGGAASNHFAHEAAGSKNYTEDGVYVQPGQPGQPGGTGGTPAVFYSTDFYTQQLIKYIDSNKDDGKPFFAYAAYTSPHWPLQVPDAWIDKYRGRYDAGYDAIRNARITRLQNLGIIPYSWTPHPVLPEVLVRPTGSANNGTAGAQYISAVHPQSSTYVDYGQGYVNKSWASLSDLEKKAQARYMELHAAMVSNLDWNIGQLIQHLKDIGAYEDTFIMFQSDNGAEGWPIDSGADPKATDELNAGPTVFPTLGKDSGLQAAKRLQYGLRWAEVSATPFAQSKGSFGEGGYGVPAFVHLPGQVGSAAPYRSFTHVIDNTATFLAIAGVTPPTTPAPADIDPVTGLDKNQGKVVYKGRNVYPITGQSLLPALGGSTAPAHSAPFGDESYGRAYIFSSDGKWKARWTEPAQGGPADGHWELFDILQDRGETNDVSAQNSAVVSALFGHWQTYMTSVGGVEPLRPAGYY
ncbi:MAG TPA: sulfatase-like hydrolase/transferase [Polyangiaceae bacterium]|nr:sulfatase-like hydrolase/transferase [Polyangiaceae bacterium]